MRVNDFSSCTLSFMAFFVLILAYMGVCTGYTTDNISDSCPGYIHVVLHGKHSEVAPPGGESILGLQCSVLILTKYIVSPVSNGKLGEVAAPRRRVYTGATVYGAGPYKLH